MTDTNYQADMTRYMTAPTDLGVAILQRSEGSDVLFVSRAEAEQLAKQKAANSVAFVSYLEVLREIADGAVQLYGKPLRIRENQK